jgi:hypothetical protein
MPTFYGEDIDIDVDDFLNACNGNEKDELIAALIEDGYISKSQVDSHKEMSASEEIFEEHLDALHGKWNRLTKEEEEIIMVIAKRFK